MCEKFKNCFVDVGSTLFTSFLLMMAVSILIITVITGCSTGNLKRTRTLKDGTVERVELSAYAIGTDQVLNGLTFSNDETGGLEFNVGSFDSNQTKGMEEMSKLTGIIVEGAVKGAVKGVAP